MENLTIEESLEKYPHLKLMSKFIIFVSQEEIKKIQNSEKIQIDNKEVSIDILKKILSDNLYYEYAKRYFTGEINRFCISSIENGKTNNHIYYDKKPIIKGISQLISTGQLILKSDELQKYEDLKNNITFEKFLEKYQKDNYDIEIDGLKYSIPTKQLISLMQLSNTEFNELCSNDKIKKIYNIPKEHFMYATINFFQNHKVIDNFLIPQDIIERYYEIRSFRKIDLQAINKHLETTDTLQKSVKINKDLEQLILSDMPKNANDLEKAIYIYIKMCKILTYDDEYYAVKQKGEATQKHKNLNYVSTITPENNKVVCFEFNLIYSKLLDDLGIKFRSDYKNTTGFGTGHVDLEFRSDKFLVNADSVTSILQGDIMQAKLNQPLVGLKCNNVNAKTQQEFKDSLTKMYQLIAKQEGKTNQIVPHTQTLEELLREYSKITTNIKPISLNEKLSILIDKVNSTKMTGVDSLSYILQLGKILFTNQERKDNIRIVIIRNNQPIDKSRIAMANAIFALNYLNFKDNPEQNKYYYFNPNNELMPITMEDLQTKFDNKIFGYIGEESPKIPGIKEGGIKYD